MTSDKTRRQYTPILIAGANPASCQIIKIIKEKVKKSDKVILGYCQVILQAENKKTREGWEKDLLVALEKKYN